MKGKHYHLIGIGGIGMSGIAKLLLKNGVKVSGSDLRQTKITEELKELGVRVFLGHNVANIEGADLIIYSSAIKENNPEISGARSSGIPLIKRAQALAELMRQKKVIAVTGSHGKTTTASLASYLLLEAGLAPTIAVGGVLRNIDTNAYFGNGDFFVAEADESDGSFLYYQPDYSIITNIDREHLDYYGDFEKEIKAFGEFVHKTKIGGCVFACEDDSSLKDILKGYAGRHIFFGLKESADIFPKNIAIKGLSSEFDCFCGRGFVSSVTAGFIGRFGLSLGGRHNISNALAVVALGLELGIDLELIKKALLNYKGSRRRLEVKFDGLAGPLVIDDYAHHPTEIKAALAAVQGLRRKRVIAVFQPHRYTRTRLLLDDFARSFDGVDYVIVTDIYSAGESPIPGLTAESLYNKIRDYMPDKEAQFLPKEKIIAHLLGIIKPDDLVITLGAGDISKLSEELAVKLKER